MPGPADYNFDSQKSLKLQPRVTIGNSKKVSAIEIREKSPGPSCYEPKRLTWKRRASAVLFNRERRKVGSITKSANTTPGPGSYMIPCKFYDKPQFLMKKENRFRFV